MKKSESKQAGKRAREFQNFIVFSEWRRGKKKSRKETAAAAVKLHFFENFNFNLRSKRDEFFMRASRRIKFVGFEVVAEF